MNRHQSPVLLAGCVQQDISINTLQEFVNTFESSSFSKANLYIAVPLAVYHRWRNKTNLPQKVTLVRNQGWPEFWTSRTIVSQSKRSIFYSHRDMSCEKKKVHAKIILSLRIYSVFTDIEWNRQWCLSPNYGQTHKSHKLSGSGKV